MKPDRDADLCVIGGGSAGLSVAIGAAQLGVRVVLIERGRMGGECLNTGCVPSKSLLAAAKSAQAVRSARYFGIDATPMVDFKRVHSYVRSVIETIAPDDSTERLGQMGIEVIRGEACIADRRTIVVRGRAVRARRLVIATGSAPAVPALPGLDHVPYWTNEDIFDNDALPDHLIVVGGGPMGVEIGQAYCRLGARVTIVECERAMPNDDPELARPLLQRLVTEGVLILEHTDIRAVSYDGDLIKLSVQVGRRGRELRDSHLLVATGRKPRTEGLGLREAGVAYTQEGIVVDRHLQTTVRGVYAAGDVVDGPRFTHVCAHHAGVIVKNAFFRLPAKLNYRSLPWVTYTDPELAQVGATEEQARARSGDRILVIRIPYSTNDRARTERQSEGLLKLIADRQGYVLGASILGAHAGELALLWVVAIEKRLRLRDLAQTFAPYPTWGEIDKAAAWYFLKLRLRRPLIRAAVRALSWLP